MAISVQYAAAPIKEVSATCAVTESDYIAINKVANATRFSLRIHDSLRTGAVGTVELSPEDAEEWLQSALSFVRMCKHMEGQHNV